MKTAALILFAAFAFQNAALAGTGASHAPYSGSPVFEKLKTLSGEWSGTVETEGKTEPAAVRYEVTSNGSAVMEKLGPGTPHEMISMYHDEAGSTVMTHYCALGNQPKMKLAEATDSKIRFEFIPTAGIDPAKDMHMNSVTFTFESPESLVQEWTSSDAGKTMHTTTMRLKRAGA